MEKQNPALIKHRNPLTAGTKTARLWLNTGNSISEKTKTQHFNTDESQISLSRH